MSYARLGPIAQRQKGLFTHAQVRECGFTDRMVRVELDRGRWVADRERVYAAAGTPRSFERAALAVVLGSPAGTVVTGPTAAVLLGYPKAETEQIHVLTDEMRHVRLDGIVGHRSRLIVPADRTSVRGIPCVSPARAIVECSADPVLARLCKWWMDHGLREGWFRYPALRHTVDRMKPGRGRNLTLLRALVDKLHPDYDPGASQPEVRIANWLEAAGLGRPELDVPVTVNGHDYEIDGLYEPELVGFEYQSWKIHGAGQRRPFVNDARRLSRLTAAGYEIHLFTDETTEAEAVEVMGLSLKRRRMPPPT